MSRKSPESVITSQTDFWTLNEINLLFGPIAERELRQKLLQGGIQAAGVRPPAGRGRPPLVYPAGAICDLLGSLL